MGKVYRENIVHQGAMVEGSLSADPDTMRAQMFKMIAVIVVLFLFAMAPTLYLGLGPKINSRVHLKFNIDERYTACFNELDGNGVLTDNDRSNDLCLFMQKFMTSYVLIMVVMYWTGVGIALLQWLRTNLILQLLLSYQVDIYVPILRGSMSACQGILIAMAMGQTEVSDFLFIGFLFMAWDYLELAVERSNSTDRNPMGARMRQKQTDVDHTYSRVATEDDEDGVDVIEHIDSRHRNIGRWQKFKNWLLGESYTLGHRASEDGTETMEAYVHKETLDSLMYQNPLGVRDSTVLLAWILTTIFVVVMITYWWLLRFVETENHRWYIHFVWAYWVVSRVVSFLLTVGYYKTTKGSTGWMYKTTWSWLRVVVVLCEVFVTAYTPFLDAVANGHHYIM